MEKYHKGRLARKFIRIFWGIIGGGLLCIVLLFLLIGLGVFGPMPTFEELENPDSNVASEILSEDQKLLGTFFLQNRSFVTFDDINKQTVDALVATEDVRFYGHSGIDPKGLGRVLVKTLLLNQDESGGGSTLTQQLAKNLFPRDTVYSKSRIVKFTKLGISKFKEWITAVRLERNYTKNEILTMYLNTVPFGSNAFGIRMASRTFFNTTPDSLKIEEAAMLIGLVKGPTRYSPVRNPERALGRRNTVLAQMLKYGKITQPEFDSIVQIPLTLSFKQLDHNAGIGTYFRELVRRMLTAKEPRPGMYFTHEQYQADSLEWADNPLFGWCRKNLRPDGSEYNLYTDGLKIYTTLDSRLQQYAEEAVEKHLGNTLQPAADREKKKNLFSWDVPKEAREIVLRSGMHQSQRYRSLKASGATEAQIAKDFDTPIPMRIFSWKGDIDTVMTPRDSMIYYKRIVRAGFMAMDPATGYVRAYVGGVNFRHFKYDHLFSGRRQIGSTIKPFLYTLAMQEGYSPCLKVPNVPQTFTIDDKVWEPKNSGKTRYDGQMVTLRWGLANSVNNISAWLIKQFTPDAVAKLIHDMGIHAYIDPVPSIFLGTSDVSVYELVAAYAAYANAGVHIRPLIVSRIEDKNGNILARFSPDRREVISEETAYLMVQLLRAVVDRGSGLRMRYIYKLEGPIGGKTGTTQNHSDGWFMCIHPDLVMGCWVGCEDRAVHFSSMSIGQGASTALPIVGLFLQKAYADENSGVSPESLWNIPKSMEGMQFNCQEEAPTDDDADEFF